MTSINPTIKERAKSPSDIKASRVTSICKGEVNNFKYLGQIYRYKSGLGQTRHGGGRSRNATVSVIDAETRQWIKCCLMAMGINYLTPKVTVLFSEPLQGGGSEGYNGRLTIILNIPMLGI